MSSETYSLEHLCAIASPKSIEHVQQLGSLEQLEYGLKTSLKEGLSTNDDHSARIQKYGNNVLPDKNSKTFLQLVWIAFNDKVLIILSVAAVVSLAVGLYQTFGVEHEPGVPALDWIEGVAIMVAIVIVVLVGAINDWNKEKAFAKLNKKRENRNMAVLRGGQEDQISIHDVMVGDVVRFNTGDVLPVDGLLLEGFNVKTDESAQTGEIDTMKKTTMTHVFSAIESAGGQNLTLKAQGDPILLSGSKVIDGSGTMVVTAVGIHSTYGSIMMSLRDGDTELTPLQSKLNSMAETIAKFAIAAALLYFFATFIKFLVRIIRTDLRNVSGPEKGQQFLALFIESVSIIVVAIPEGLPLAVTLALAIATTRMYKDNNLVRLLRSCETMGNATTICSDKTGTLTQNKMTVVVGNLGGAGDFAFGKNAAAAKTNPKETIDVRAHVGETTAPKAELELNNLHPDVQELLKQSIIINSTATEEGTEGSGVFGGSRTEVALLQFTQASLGVTSMRTEKAKARVVSALPFNSANKYMATLVELPAGNNASSSYRVYVKGAPDILLKLCTHLIAKPADGLHDQPLTSEKISSIQGLQNDYAERSLRTLCLIYKDCSTWPSWFPKMGVDAEDESTSNDNTAVNEKETGAIASQMSDMTFLGIVGIQDPLRDAVPEAVLDCKMAGVVVRMVTGDNLATAKAIALDAGIYSGDKDEIIMEGNEFRKMNDADMKYMLPRLRVLARAVPEDKRILVQALKQLGETVAVTGDGTNDAPALKLADVGFAMGSGTEVAKEASDIILLDDNFASIVRALLWGRTINDAVKKFVQFQLTVNITAVLTTFVSGLYQNEPILSAVQLLWLNLIMDTLAALALATDSPTRSLLERKPERKEAPFVSVPMWKMIIGQAIFQIAVVFIMMFTGPTTLFGWLSDGPEADVTRRWNSTIFNMFVWFQIFNAFNCRRIDNRFNIFEGVTKNFYFIGILAVMIGGQIMIVFVGGAALDVERLGGAEWAISILLGILTLPLGCIIRAIPDSWCAALVPPFLKRYFAWERINAAMRTEKLDLEAQKHGWNMEGFMNDLKFLKKYKGGRMQSMKFKITHPRQSRQVQGGGLCVAALVAGTGVVAGSVGGIRAVRQAERVREANVEEATVGL